MSLVFEPVSSVLFAELRALTHPVRPLARPLVRYPLALVLVAFGPDLWVVVVGG